MSMTEYLENTLLNSVLKGGTYKGASVYAALFTSDPGESGMGTEVSDSAYVRQPVTFGEIAKGTISNNCNIDFPPASENYGTITHVGIFDAETGGNLLFYQELETSIIAPENTGVRIATGDLTVTLD